MSDKLTVKVPIKEPYKLFLEEAKKKINALEKRLTILEALVESLHP